MTEPNIFTRERRATAVHEAAHCVLATRFGVLARAAIWPNNSDDLSQRSWVGTCRVFGNPHSMGLNCDQRRLLRLEAPRKRWNVYVGLAGAVGELMDSGASDPYTAWEYLCDWDLLSPTDLQLIGCEFGEDDICATFRCLRRHWADVEREARQLIAFPLDSAEDAQSVLG